MADDVVRKYIDFDIAFLSSLRSDGTSLLDARPAGLQEVMRHHVARWGALNGYAFGSRSMRGRWTCPRTVVEDRREEYKDNARRQYLIDMKWVLATLRLGAV